MRTQKTTLIALTIFQILLWSVSGQCQGPTELDGDWPSSLEVVLESTLAGNPLDDGDEIYGLRGSHRFFSGNLGMEAQIGYAEPTSELVEDLGDAELLLLDLSVVWYANYHTLNKINRLDGKPWHRNRRIKPEFIVFGGPGWASLRIKDAFPDFALSDASKDFFTVNGGFGAKLYWMSDDPEKNWNHRTSRFYLRPEVRARWFVGDGGSVDWGVSLALGYSIGNRPSQRALDLKVAEGCKEVKQYLTGLAEKMKQIPGNREESLQNTGELAQETLEYRRGLENFKARVMSCGPKCESSLSCLDDGIGKLNVALSKLRPLPEGAD